MPLTLARKAGETFFVGDTEWLVVSFDAEAVRLRLASAGVCTWEIVEWEAREIMQDVFVSRGDVNHFDSCTLAFTAPREIHIFRSEVYHSRDKNGTDPETRRAGR